MLDRGAPARGRTPTVDALPAAKAKTAAAYRAWVERAGSQEAAFTGEEIWTPERRFGRVFERLALPGFNRAARFDLLTALGAAGRYPLEADAAALRRGRPHDARGQARCSSRATGCCSSAARRDLAEAADLPIAALDRGLAVWGTPGEHVDLTAEPAPGVAAALGLGIATWR